MAPLYTHLFEMKMKINENENALKGQQIIAQGFGVSAQSNGNALGWKAGRRIVRAITFNREDFYIRTKGEFRIFRSIKATAFRPKKIICFFHRIPTDGFLRIPFPLGVAVRLSAHAEAQG